MYHAVGLKTKKQYAMAGKKSELLKKLALIFPSFIQLPQSDGTFRKKSLKKIYPEPLRIIKGDKKMKSLVKKPTPWDEKPCPYCGGKVIYTDNSRIYHGRTYGNGKCFVCTNCGASVGVHGNLPTHKPLGLLATPEMKSLKTSCHSFQALVTARC